MTDIAAVLSAVPSRLQRRARTLVEQVPDPVPETVDFGGETVTVASLTCTCLLSPKCAHVAAVCLALPDGDATSAESSPETAVSPEGATEPTEPGPGVPPFTADISAVPEVFRLMEAIIEHGLVDLPIHHRTALAAVLQRVRVSGLFRLDRALTGVVSAAEDLAAGKTVNRDAVTGAFARALLTCRLLELERQEGVGTGRRVYSPLPGGALIPVGAEPVLTSSGFAGATVIFVGSGGRRYSLGRTPPGGLPDVSRIWSGPAAIGDVKAGMSDVARHKLLLTGGTGSEDGRLGTGKGIRAALGAEVTSDDLAELDLPDGMRILQGTVQSVDRHGIILDSGVSGVFGGAARACGVDGLVIPGQRILMVVDAGTVIAVRPDDGDVLFPGLDVPGDSDVSPTVPSGDWHRGPQARIDDWLSTLVFGGGGMVRRSSGSIAGDAAACIRDGAPFAGELLSELAEGGAELRIAMKLAAY